MTKGTCMSDKTDLDMRQKRPTYVTEETYTWDKRQDLINVLRDNKRDLQMRQKRPTHATKETRPNKCLVR